MPIYEFRCLTCRREFELLVIKAGDGDLLNCPHCQGVDFERVLSAANHALGGGSASGGAAASRQTRRCAGGSCTTYDLPGPKG
jgi:putative FmdB family regulatory protein